MDITGKSKVNDEGRADWGFQLPEEGKHLLKFLEGIEDFTNESSGKESIMFPCQVLDDDENEDGRINIFAPRGTKYGETIIADILVCTGLAEQFEKNLPDGMELTDPEVVEKLKIKLPDKYIFGEIEHNEYQGKTSARVIAIERYGKSGAGKSTVKKKTAPAGDSDWE